VQGSIALDQIRAIDKTRIVAQISHLDEQMAMLVAIRNFLLFVRVFILQIVYQNRPKVETTCVHCGNKFDSKITLGKHLIRSVLCKKLRESKENNETTELSNLD
jgi:hypothetical protein